MAVLSGGGNWLALQKDPVGTVTEGCFVSFTPDVPSSNPAFGKQDQLVLEVAGENKIIGCPTALGRVFRANAVKPGTALAITYEGQKKGKKGTPFHSFHVETLDTSFDMKPANEPMSMPAVAANEEMSAEERDLAARLAAARARRAA
jgi:hypothetical protein